MADINLKTETPDTSLPTTGFLFGADSQAAASPSVYTTQAVATTLLGSTTLSGATITADAPVLNMSQTWNNGAVTFTGLKFNAAGTSDANSAAASLLMDLQVGGTSKFSIAKNGNIEIASSAATITAVPAANNTLTISANGTNTFLQVTHGGQGVSVRGNGTDILLVTRLSGLTVGSLTPRLGFTASDINAPDAFLSRRAAANLRLGAADVGATTATVTITIAAPGVVTWSSHSLSTGTPVVFTTTGALPTGIVSGTTYYAVVVTDSTFQLASSVANAIAATPTVITTSGTQSGTHTGTRYNITQRLSMQSITGVTDRLGADLFIQGSQGTGTGAGGSIIFQVAPAGGSGSAQNALATTAQFGPFQGKLYLGSASPTSSNYAIWGDGTNTWVNAPTSGGYVHFGSLDNWGVAVHPASVRISSNFTLGWTASNPGAALDTILAREAPNTLALRNGANAQAFRVYNTYTDATTFERANIFWDSNVLKIGTEKGSVGGTARALELQTDGTTRLTIGTTGNATHTGWVKSNLYFDAPAASLGGNGGIYFGVGGTGAQIQATAVGVLALANYAGTDFSRLQFGGTSSAFPALKRSSTTLQAVLANDGGFTNIQGKLTTDTAYTATTIVPTGYLTLYDSTGTAYRVPCVV